jgi:putative FmdB family regulatory protein
MPTYDYSCETCNDVVEVVRGVNDTDDVTCAACSGTRKKKFTSPPVMFVDNNGAGKYIK